MYCHYICIYKYNLVLENSPNLHLFKGNLVKSVENLNINNACLIVMILQISKITVSSFINSSQFTLKNGLCFTVINKTKKARQKKIIVCSKCDSRNSRHPDDSSIYDEIESKNRELELLREEKQRMKEELRERVSEPMEQKQRMKEELMERESELMEQKQGMKEELRERESELMEQKQRMKEELRERERVFMEVHSFFF